jgi:hypothetical protein
MAFNVAEFRANMVGDGARANLFEITMAFPNFAGDSTQASRQIRFMAKAAQLPGSTIGTAPLYYFGRELKFAGNRTFPDWTITVINDEDFLIRNSFESWLNNINSHAGNKRNGAAENSSVYSADASVVQYTKVGEITKRYRFVGMFPVDVAPIDLDWGTNDSIEEFAVTFAYQWWESDTTS